MLKLFIIREMQIKNYMKIFPHTSQNDHHQKNLQDFPGGSMVKNLPANAGDTSLIPDPGRFHMPQGN